MAKTILQIRKSLSPHFLNPPPTPSIMSSCSHRRCLRKKLNQRMQVTQQSKRQRGSSCLHIRSVLKVKGVWPLTCITFNFRIQLTQFSMTRLLMKTFWDTWTLQMVDTRFLFRTILVLEGMLQKYLPKSGLSQGLALSSIVDSWLLSF